MKGAIVTLVMALGLVGFAGLPGAMASTPATGKAPCCAPAYTNYIGAPGSCPTMNSVGVVTPSIMGGVGF